MASIGRDQNGNRRILFCAPDGKRKTIRLGKVSQRLAEGIKLRVEQLLEAKQLSRPMEGELSQWVSNLEPRTAKRLAAVCLIAKPEARVVATLGPFLKAYIDGRVDLKPATKIVRGQVIRDLKQFFGESRDVETITPGNADDFKQWLIGRKLAPTTIHKRLQSARSFFHAMRRRKLIGENPFDEVKLAATGMKDRQQFISREEIARVLDACPDHHWRAIVALSRFGGLRCPSEVLSLRWQDIDWKANRIVVQSPKTEHHAGKASRIIPFFPELLPVLLESFDLAPNGAEFVVDAKFRKAAMGAAGWMSVNLRTTFGKIIKRAGLQLWPRMFHNMRASRETELVETYPVQVVTSWLGNTPSVALRHYLMTTEKHFEAAVRGDGQTVKSTEEKAAQNPAQSVHAGSRFDSHARIKKPRTCRGLRVVAFWRNPPKWRGQDSNL
ncbi:MAG: tyrosine-type recombinase/integrase [Planctomycetia bacterium]|nr:tyrosine-type recombinase/integrase [Planctomycetia bacterium]